MLFVISMILTRQLSPVQRENLAHLYDLHIEELGFRHQLMGISCRFEAMQLQKLFTLGRVLWADVTSRDVSVVYSDIHHLLSSSMAGCNSKTNKKKAFDQPQMFGIA